MNDTFVAGLAMTVFVGIGGREASVCELSLCANVLKLIIVQSGGGCYLSWPNAIVWKSSIIDECAYDQFNFVEIDL